MRIASILMLLLCCHSLFAANDSIPPATIRTAVAKGLQVVQKAARNYPEHRDCFSCHHQTLPMLAMDLAGQRGLAIDRKLIQSQAEFTWNTFNERRERLAKGKGIGGAAMTVGYGLWALDIAKWKPDTTTEAMVDYLLQRQREDGSWHRSSDRPPLEQSDFTCGILAIHYMRKFATEDQKADVETSAARLKAWVEATPPESHEDAVSRLGAMALLRCDPGKMAALRDQILSAQKPDGGWSQLAEMDSDAYATGLTLFTLHRTRLKATDARFQQGLHYLLKTQHDDGSWHVKTRSKPIQELFDNGDPHGLDQFISIAATSWATAALSLALPNASETTYNAATPPTDDALAARETYDRGTDVEPMIVVADGLNEDGNLVKNYRRGLRYAMDYFGNYGPYYVYLLGPGNKSNVREIFRMRAERRVDVSSSTPANEQIDEFLRRENVVSEIDAVLAGKAEGGLTWTQSPPVLYEDVTTNATERMKNPIENTWGALHEYHHVFQMAQCDTREERSSDRHINSWMAEGMATYSSAKFMDNMSLIDFKSYMRELRKTGGNIGGPGINEFIATTKSWQLQNETYWDGGPSPQVYYMVGAWATAWLIHVQGVDEVTVLKTWYHDIPKLGKAKAFEQHMGISLPDFYEKFDNFIRQSDEEVMKILP